MFDSKTINITMLDFFVTSSVRVSLLPVSAHFYQFFKCGCSQMGRLLVMIDMSLAERVEKSPIWNTTKDMLLLDVFSLLLALNRNNY